MMASVIASLFSSARPSLETATAIGRQRGVCHLMAMGEQEIVLVLCESPERGANASGLPDLRGEEGIVSDALRHGGAVHGAINALFGVADL